MNYTKGEWVTDGTRIIDKEDETIAVIFIRFKDDKVSAENALIDEAEANAQLIAAAPAMYEALKKAEKLLGNMDSRSWAEAIVYDQITKALAKAEGKEEQHASKVL